MFSGQHFEFSRESLQFSQIGAPKRILDKVENGFYEPVISQRAKRRTAQKFNTIEEYYSSLNFESSAEEGDETENPGSRVTASDVSGGVLPVKDYSVALQVKVEEILENICQTLVTSFEERFNPLLLMLKSKEVFIEDKYEWFISEEDSNNNAGLEIDDYQGVNVAKQNFYKAREKLKPVISLLSTWSCISMQFEVDRVTEGFIEFIKISKHLSENSETTLEDRFKYFSKRFKGRPNIEEFSVLFEKINIKSYSEALAEHVGSIVKLSAGKNRNLEPYNLDKVRFNCRQI